MKIRCESRQVEDLRQPSSRQPDPPRRLRLIPNFASVDRTLAGVGMGDHDNRPSRLAGETVPCTIHVVDYKSYSVSRRDKQPLLDFLLDGLRAAGCRVINATDADTAPFRISFETPSAERLGIICYAFLANQRVTRNRPTDEHRFQVKYGAKDGGLLHLWRDPFELYTTLFMGVSPEGGFFVGADPAMHTPSKLFISIEFKQQHADAVLTSGWHAWERDKKQSPLADPVEVLVGGTRSRLLDYIRFERLAQRLDQGPRQLLAEKFAAGDVPALAGVDGPVLVPKPEAVHQLAKEFEMPENAILDLIASARRLKMAVRGWVAEEKLVAALSGVDGVTECQRLDEEGGPDVSLRFRGSRPVTIQCKNVLRQRMADGTIRLDFQKTRVSKGDPCTRYYRAEEFDLVAACLHAVTERWEFRYALPGKLDGHTKCPGRLSQNVKIDMRWDPHARAMLEAAART